MNESTEEAPPAAEDRPRRRGCAPGCLLPLLAVAAIAVALFFIIGFIFNEGDNADQPVHGFDAGPADAFPPATINQYDPEHLFITRLQDGTFIALYDRSPRQQELQGDCRVHYDDLAQLGSLEQLDGFSGGLVENCSDITASVWRADGEFAFGAGYGHLDTYNTHVNSAGHLIVDTDTRSCTRSRGASGVPPFDVLICGRGD